MSKPSSQVHDLARLAKGFITSGFVCDVLRSRHRPRIVAEWESSGRSVPAPPEVKRSLLLEYAKQYNLSLLVETGTFWGGTVAAMRRHFRRVISIELEPRMARHSQRRFARFSNVSIIHGDSARELARVVSELPAPTLFWLDGHDSGGDTAATEPLGDELVAVMQAPAGSVVLIDDARVFTGTPRLTLDEIAKATQKRFAMAIRDDVIRLTPS
jgi:hypothetical protein